MTLFHQVRQFLIFERLCVFALFHVSIGLDVVTAFHPSLSWMLVIMVVKEMILSATKFSLAFPFALFEQMNTQSTTVAGSFAWKVTPRLP